MKYDTIQHARTLLENMTPLAIDCGTLCGQNCCKGDANTGMLLFPGEEQLFQNIKDNRYTIKDSGIILPDNHTIKHFTCDGTCPREQRPLACRIFPFMPYLAEDSTLEFRLDLKTVTVCPLAYDTDKYEIQAEFIDALYDAFALLIEDDKIIEFISILSDDYDDMVKLINM